jgi:exonuclease VII large subunit
MAVKNRLERTGTNLVWLAGKLSGLSVKNTLKRGFAIIRKAGTAIDSVAGLSNGDSIELELIDGTKSAVIDD